MKKSKVLSLLTAGAMCVAMLPMSAFAAGTDAPHVDSATIAGAQSVSDANGNLYLTVPSNTQLAGQTFTMTTSEAVSFVGTDAPNAGELYAVEGSDTAANLRFAIDLSNIPNLDVNFNTPAYSIDLNSEDGMNWSGSFNEGFAANMATLGQGLTYADSSLRAGMMKNESEEGNIAWDIYTNSDAVNTQLVICDPESDLVPVTYIYGEGKNEKYNWTLPEGAPLPQIAVPGNYDVEGWYYDDQYTNAINFETATVAATGDTGVMEVFAKTTSTGSGDSFLEDLEDENATILHIGSPEDFNDFVSHSTEVDPDQTVVLTTSIDLNNASYQAIQFEGNFDGQGNTISNVKFTARGNYAGMFSELGATQKIVNLNLNNVTATGGILSSYVGTLAGWVYGVNETPRENCLIQNVHVTGGSVSGYTCGGLVGYSFASMIRYCSVDGTSVSGMANGGGIAGLTYGDIIACYSDEVTPFALQARGRGGIVGKLLESGKILDCWCGYSPAYGSNEGGTVTNVVYTSDIQPLWNGWNTNLTEHVWTLGNQTATFIQSEIEYDFDV